MFFSSPTPRLHILSWSRLAPLRRAAWAVEGPAAQILCVPHQVAIVHVDHGHAVVLIVEGGARIQQLLDDFLLRSHMEKAHCQKSSSRARDAGACEAVGARRARAVRGMQARVRPLVLEHTFAAASRLVETHAAKRGDGLLFGVVTSYGEKASSSMHHMKMAWR